MGFFKKKGVRCEPTPEGHLRCRPYEADKNQKFATGTDVTLALDPNSCKVSFMGEMDIQEDDREQIERTAQQMEAACRKGLI